MKTKGSGQIYGCAYLNSVHPISRYRIFHNRSIRSFITIAHKQSRPAVIEYRLPGIAVLQIQGRQPAGRPSDPDLTAGCSDGAHFRNIFDARVKKGVGCKTNAAVATGDGLNPGIVEMVCQTLPECNLSQQTVAELFENSSVKLTRDDIVFNDR